MSDDYLSCADTAKLVRAALKQAFPRQKFSVRSSVYSMGASIHVGWIDGPQVAAVDPVVKQFAGAGFDGMIDLKTHNQHWLYPDGTVQLFQFEVGHSYGSTTLDLLNEKVDPEQARDYIAGARAAFDMGTAGRITPTSEAYQAGQVDAAARKAQGARLVHFGADYVFAERELSAATREQFQQAIVLLGGGDPKREAFEPNKRYSLAIPGRAYEDYGNTLVWQVSSIDQGVLAEAISSEQQRRHA
jgi:hypothetical protein